MEKRLTEIIDKNGKLTRVWKNLEASSTKSVSRVSSIKPKKDKYPLVTNEEMNIRLNNIPKGEIPIIGIDAKEALEANDLIIHPQDIGLNYMKFEDARKLHPQIYQVQKDHNPRYMELDPSQDNFVSIQASIRLDAIAHYIKKPSDPFGFSWEIEPRILLTKNQEYIIVDGNHRVSAALLTGRKIECAVVKEKEESEE